MTVLAVTNIKGGVGKTTTAVNLAFLSARRGTPTLLWDLDPQGAATFTFRVRPQVSVSCARLLRDEDALADSIKGTDFPGLDLLPADFSYRKLDTLLVRSDRKGHGLARALLPLREQYARILLDCPPGISFLAENVFSAADALIVPTIPTVLSLRTVARLARHVADRRDRCPLLLPFLSMVDRRKALHVAVAEDVRAGGPWLATPIPYASVMEQMSVQRSPLGAFAGGSPGAGDVERLWAEVLAELDRPRDDDDRRRGCLALADDIDELLRKLERGSGAGPRRAEPPRTPDIRLALGGEADVAALLRVLGAGSAPPSGAEQLDHYFDTADEILRTAGCWLRLREEDGRFVVTAGGGMPHEGGDRDDEQARIDASWALEILAGRRSPLDVLRSRLGRRPAPLLARLADVIADRPLQRTVSFRNVRRRLGPIALAELPAVRLEVERTEFPGGRVLHELAVEVPAEGSAACEVALQRIFEHANVPWRPAASTDLPVAPMAPPPLPLPATLATALPHLGA